jgi:hypothetical protein
MSNITHKRGDTFEVVVDFTLNGQVVDITGWQVRSQIRSATKTLLKELDIVRLNDVTGTFSLNATSSETEAWQPGAYDCDIEFIDQLGFVISSDTFSVSVIRDITRDFTP